MGIIILLSACSNLRSRDNQNIKIIISLENKIQNSNVSECEKSLSIYRDIAEIGRDKTRKINYLTFLEDQMLSIDSLSNQLITEIDGIKKMLFKNGNEKVKLNEIKLSKFRGQILSYNLHEVVDKLNLNPCEDVLFNQKKGEALWKNYSLFVKNLLRLTATYSVYNNHFSFSPRSNYEGNSFEDKLKNFKKHLSSSKANLNDDESVLKQLYADLYRPEFTLNEDDETVSLNEFLFKKTTLIEAISILTNLQNDILKAKNTSLQHIQYRITSCREYPFDTFIPIITGPSAVKVGEDVEIFVRFGAYDSNENPMLTSSGGTVWCDGDGAGTIKFKAKKGMNKFNGKILIKLKSGEIRSRPWEWSVYGAE